MSSYTDKELDKMTIDLYNGLVWVFDKYPKEKYGNIRISNLKGKIELKNVLIMSQLNNSFPLVIHLFLGQNYTVLNCFVTIDLHCLKSECMSPPA